MQSLLTIHVGISLIIAANHILGITHSALANPVAYMYRPMVLLTLYFLTGSVVGDVLIPFRARTCN
jgi:hypothetical protein